MLHFVLLFFYDGGHVELAFRSSVFMLYCYISHVATIQFLFDIKSKMMPEKGFRCSVQMGGDVPDKRIVRLLKSSKQLFEMLRHLVSDATLTKKTFGELRLVATPFIWLQHVVQLGAETSFLFAPLRCEITKQQKEHVQGFKHIHRITTCCAQTQSQDRFSL